MKYAFEIDEIVNTAVTENSLNPTQMENDINSGMLKLLFRAIGIDNAKTLAKEVIGIARLGLSRGK